MIPTMSVTDSRSPVPARRADAAELIPIPAARLAVTSGPFLRGGEMVAHRADEQAARLVAEADSRRYRFLAKAIPQIVWTATPDGRLDSFNPRWAEYTGLELDHRRARPRLDCGAPPRRRPSLARRLDPRPSAKRRA